MRPWHPVVSQVPWRSSSCWYSTPVVEMRASSSTCTRSFSCHSSSALGSQQFSKFLKFKYRRTFASNNLPPPVRLKGQASPLVLPLELEVLM